jgi:hypothetical protein
VSADGDWHMVLVDGAPRIGVRLAPDHTLPQWPDGPSKQQVHLDLWVEDFAEAHEEVMALVATPAARVIRRRRSASRGGPRPSDGG